MVYKMVISPNYQILHSKVNLKNDTSESAAMLILLNNVIFFLSSWYILGRVSVHAYLYQSLHR